MGCPTRRGGQQRGTALRSWRADQPPPIPVVTLPVPLHSGQLSPSSLPEPLQAGHRFSPVPGVPGGASSPGFVGSVSLISSSLCRRKPSGSDTVPGRAFMQTSRACACHPAPWPPLALSGMGMSGRLSYPPLAGPSATSGSGLPGECGPLPPASGVMFLFSRCSGAGGTVPKASRAASTSCGPDGFRQDRPLGPARFDHGVGGPITPAWADTQRGPQAWCQGVVSSPSPGQA
jgi:hypothetical protein